MKSLEQKILTKQTDMNEIITPCGCLNLFDESGDFVSFDVCASERTRLRIYDDIVEEHISVNAILNEIIIDPQKLAVGKKYVLKLSGDYHFEYGDADEYSISNVVSTEEASLSLGAYDPNDIEKEKQWIPDSNGSGGWVPPVEYDESNFHCYVLKPLEDWSGFSFRLLDFSMPKIMFKLAWINHLHDVQVSEYQNVVTSLSMF